MSKDLKPEMCLCLNKYSKLISEYLEKEGYGVLHRNENKCTQLIGQLTEYLSISCKSIACGGQAEGSALPEDSDSDVMGVIKGFRVSEKQNVPFFSFGEDDVTHVCMERSKQYPGYCKLELLHVPRTVCAEDTLFVIKCAIKHGDSVFISSKLIKEKFPILGLIPSDNLDGPLYEVNGPAVKNRGVDCVRSFEFNKWPEEAKIWKERPRKHNWPSREVLNRLEKNVSCYVVPKGNEFSVEFEVEWRLSFVEIERELIWSMNDAQFKCYICLKRIIKKFKIWTGFEKITTYQIKNIMFWLCEMIPAHEWKTENILRYVCLGLTKFQNCIRQGYNAHYFIPEMNLLRNVKLSATEKRNVYCVLTKHIDDPRPIFDYLQKTSSKTSFIYNRRIISKTFSYDRRCSILMDYCENLDETNLVNLYKEMLLQFPDTKILVPCMAITKSYIRLRELCKGFHTDDIDDLTTTIFVNDIVKEMQAGHKTDYLTASLNIALVCSFFKRYLDVRKVLKSKLLNDTQKLYLYRGTPYYLVLNKAKVERVKDNNSSIGEDKQDVVLQYFIRRSEKMILPFPLKLQKCLFGETRRLFQVFPLVLAYYLLFKSELYLGLKNDSEKTRKLLKLAVLTSHFHEFYYFNLYLLGYSYYCTGDMKEAYKWFAQSACQKPTRFNAAVYQIAIMINDGIQGKTK